MINALITYIKIIYEILRRLIFSHSIAVNGKKVSNSLLQEILGSCELLAIDVGAAHGLLPHWEFLDGIAKIIQIDPRIEACADLEEIKQRRPHSNLYHIECVALSEHGGEKTLYVSNSPTGTSLFKIDPSNHLDEGDYVDQKYLYPLVEQRIKTEKLSQVMKRLSIESFDLIKLDVQGSELPILRGLEECHMIGALAVELEIGLHTLYPEEISFSSIDSFLRKKGFELFDVRVARTHRIKENDDEGYQKIFNVVENSPSISARVWEFDAIYFRKKSKLIEERDIDKIKKMIVVYCTYNFYSEAYSLVEKSVLANIMSVTDGNRLLEKIVKLHNVLNYREWFSRDPASVKLLKFVHRISPRNAPRWCQYMYQNYPNG